MPGPAWGRRASRHPPAVPVQPRPGVAVLRAYFDGFWDRALAASTTVRRISPDSAISRFPYSVRRALLFTATCCPYHRSPPHRVTWLFELSRDV
jgi:hypothetical protein